MIFDYLGNFDFFRANKDGIEGNEAKSLTESIFSRRISLIYNLQTSAFNGEAYQAMRESLIEYVLEQIKTLNTELISVKLQLKYIEKYKTNNAFICLFDMDKHDLITYIAPIVYMEDMDEYAKGFDNFMYGMMLASIEEMKYFKKAQKQLKNTCIELSKRATIPQIKEKLELINTIGTDEFWAESDILTFEKVRVELRDLIKFIVDNGSNRTIFTDITDTILLVKEGEEMDSAYDFEDYRLKVNRYIEVNKDHMAIHKLRNNIPLTAYDYGALEKLLTSELGTKDDYKREFGETPFGLMIRKIAKLQYDDAKNVFSDFINEQSLDQEQIVFVNKIVDYVVENGYIEDISELVEPPFDKPQRFVNLFDGSKQKEIAELVKKIKDNAIKVVG